MWRLLNRFNFSSRRQQLKNLLDVDLNAIAGKTGITEHHAQRMTGGKFFNEGFVNVGIETGGQGVVIDKENRI